MAVTKFDKETIKKIAKEYIHTKDISYKKLAAKYGCSSSTITRIMNEDLKSISKVLFFLADKKAKRNKKLANEKFFTKKK